MFIRVMNDGLNNPDYQSLAINLETGIKIVAKLDELSGRYALIIEEQTHFVDKENYINPYVIIHFFQTKQDAIDYCDLILEAYQKGDRVWTSPKSNF